MIRQGTGTGQELEVQLPVGSTPSCAGSADLEIRSAAGAGAQGADLLLIAPL
jgi:hypothetical protein